MQLLLRAQLLLGLTGPALDTGCADHSSATHRPVAPTAAGGSPPATRAGLPFTITRPPPSPPLTRPVPLLNPFNTFSFFFYMLFCNES